MTATSPLWVLLPLVVALLVLVAAAYTQFRRMVRYTDAERVLAESLLDHHRIFSMVQEQAMLATRSVDQMLLIIRTLEWRQVHDLSEFNELVMWKLAEDLAIDRTLASNLYDKLTKRIAESPDKF